MTVPSACLSPYAVNRQPHQPTEPMTPGPFTAAIRSTRNRRRSTRWTPATAAAIILPALAAATLILGLMVFTAQVIAILSH